MKCNQCNATMINGVFCHELGCPNTHLRRRRHVKYDRSIDPANGQEEAVRGSTAQDVSRLVDGFVK